MVAIGNAVWICLTGFVLSIFPARYVELRLWSLRPTPLHCIIGLQSAVAQYCCQYYKMDCWKQSDGVSVHLDSDSDTKCLVTISVLFSCRIYTIHLFFLTGLQLELGRYNLSYFTDGLLPQVSFYKTSWYCKKQYSFQFETSQFFSLPHNYQATKSFHSVELWKRLPTCCTFSNPNALGTVMKVWFYLEQQTTKHCPTHDKIIYWYCKMILQTVRMMHIL